MPPKTVISHDPHSACLGSTLSKWILERDEVYNDQSHTHRALKHLSYINEHDFNTTEDPINYFEPPSTR
jgi:hypothetical protein